MALIMNHNLSSVAASRHLGKTLGTLSKSIERLSSGLRINSAADDAAGMAVRELMRADVVAGYQGIRNAADAISMLQTADGALSIIDEKLIRMKELAEQAATGVYTEDQRELINSEYQAMAAEIDRIANTTNFNGLKLLDGSVTAMNGGRGMTVHFGVGNSEAEDYYFVNIGDSRATSITGLKIGGDAKNDIWGQGAAGGTLSAGAGCCTAGYSSLNGEAGFADGDSITYGYNWDRVQDYDPGLLTGRYIAGRYAADSEDSLQDLVNRVNAGTQSRVGIELDAVGIMDAVYDGGTLAICLGDEAYIFGDETVAGGLVKVAGNSGPIYGYTATGQYDGGGFMFNGDPGYGIGLTAAQRQSLDAAGVDLAPLGLAGVTVTAIGESEESSGDARNSLRAGLAQAFNSLSMGNLRSLVTAPGVTEGFTINYSDVSACAYSTVVNGTGLQATIAAGQTLKVHTGVYSDQNGNWTDDRAVASALELDEIVLNFENYGGSRSVATLVAGNTYVSDEYVVNQAKDIAIWGYDAGMINLAGLDLAKLGFVSAAVTGNFRGVGSTPALALSDLQDQIESSWKNKWSNVDNRLKFSGRTSTPYNASQVLMNFNSGTIVTQNDLNGANAARLNVSREIVGDQSVHITLDIWKQSGTGVWTSSYAVASELNAMGANFKRIELAVTSDTGGSDYFISVNGDTTVTYGSWTPAGKGKMNLDDLADQIAVDTAAYLSSFVGGGRLWYAPEAGPTSLFPPTLAEVSKSTKSSVKSAVPDYLTVTADIAGSTVDIETGTASVLARNTASLATIAGVAGMALSKVLSDAQNSSSAAGNTGTGRIVASAATPPAASVPLTQVLNLKESVKFVSGDLLRSVATGSFTFDSYGYSAASKIGLSSVQLKAFANAGFDLGRLYLTKPSVTSSVSSTVSSASARQALVESLNQLWNLNDFSDFSAFTVLAGVRTGYAALDRTSILAHAAPGVMSGNAGTATIDELQTLVVHTGIFTDAQGNWTDSATIASAMKLQEMTYSLENTRRTWVRMAGTFVSSAYVSGNLTITSALADQLEVAGLLMPARFLKASVRVYSSAHSLTEASALLYSSGLSAFDAVYAGHFYSLEIDDTVTNSSRISDFTVAQLSASATGANVTGTGAAATVKAGSSLLFHTGIFGSGNGFWTDDRGIASAYGMTEIVYTVAAAIGTGDYTVTMAGPVSWNAGYGTTAAISFDQLGIDLAKDLRAVIGGKQATGSEGYLYRGALTTPLEPSPDDFKPRRSSLAMVAGDPTLKVTFAIEGQELSYLPYGPSPLASLAHDTNIDAIVAALNTNLAAVVSGLQTGAAVKGAGGAGRIVRAANSPPSVAITLADVEGLSVQDIYVPYSSDSMAGTDGVVGRTLRVTMVASAGTSPSNPQGESNFGAWALASAINHNPDSQFWAMVQGVNSQGRAADMVYVFAKEGGDLDSLMADEAAADDAASRAGLDSILFEHVETAVTTQSATHFSLGGRNWASMSPFQSRATLGGESWYFTLNGRDAGAGRDIWIANSGEVVTPALLTGTATGLNRYGFVEIQNAADGDWAGADIRTQSTAQEALGAVTAAIMAKDRIRAGLGAVQNRLENTLAALTLQLDSLQAAESRISDVDVALEMSTFTKANILAQAATSMLAQANSLGALALTLIRA